MQKVKGNARGELIKEAIRKNGYDSVKSYSEDNHLDPGVVGDHINYPEIRISKRYKEQYYRLKLTDEQLKPVIINHYDLKDLPTDELKNEITKRKPVESILNRILKTEGRSIVIVDPELSYYKEIQKIDNNWLQKRNVSIINTARPVTGKIMLESEQDNHTKEFNPFMIVDKDCEYTSILHILNELPELDAIYKEEDSQNNDEEWGKPHPKHDSVKQLIGYIACLLVRYPRIIGIEPGFWGIYNVLSTINTEEWHKKARKLFRVASGKCLYKLHTIIEFSADPQIVNLAIDVVKPYINRNDLQGTDNILDLLQDKDSALFINCDYNKQGLNSIIAKIIINASFDFTRYMNVPSEWFICNLACVDDASLLGCMFKYSNASNIHIVVSGEDIFNNISPYMGNAIERSIIASRANKRKQIDDTLTYYYYKSTLEADVHKNDEENWTDKWDPYWWERKDEDFLERCGYLKSLNSMDYGNKSTFHRKFAECFSYKVNIDPVNHEKSVEFVANDKKIETLTNEKNKGKFLKKTKKDATKALYKELYDELSEEDRCKLRYVTASSSDPYYTYEYENVLDCAENLGIAKRVFYSLYRDGDIRHLIGECVDNMFGKIGYGVNYNEEAYYPIKNLLQYLHALDIMKIRRKDTMIDEDSLHYIGNIIKRCRERARHTLDDYYSQNATFGFEEESNGDKNLKELISAYYSNELATDDEASELKEFIDECMCLECDINYKDLWLGKVLDFVIKYWDYLYINESCAHRLLYVALQSLPLRINLELKESEILDIVRIIGGICGQGPKEKDDEV